MNCSFSVNPSTRDMMLLTGKAKISSHNQHRTNGQESAVSTGSKKRFPGARLLCGHLLWSKYFTTLPIPRLSLCSPTICTAKHYQLLVLLPQEWKASPTDSRQALLKVSLQILTRVIWKNGEVIVEFDTMAFTNDSKTDNGIGAGFYSKS